MLDRRRVCSALIGAATAVAVAPGRADELPAGPVRIIVPAVAGGGSDILARLLAGRLADLWRRSVVSENIPGAAGGVAARTVRRSPADGRTLLMGSTGTLMAAASGVDGGLVSEFRVTDHFAPIALVAAPPYVLTLHPGVRATTVRSLIRLARDREVAGFPLRYGSSGSGAASHLTGVLFQQQAGVLLEHVPLLGTGAAMQELLDGRLDLLFAPPPTIRDTVEDGRLLAVATTGRTRSPTFPAIPTIAESGLPGFESVGWFGLLAPRGTPDALVARIADDVGTLLRRPDLRDRLAALGTTPQPTSPTAFARYIDADVAKWTALLIAPGALRIDALPR
ncbi:Bug family tripartite tricarboxylate transporter substrate binding protein [Rhodoplanes azumiensis]|uniref:Bug family tripartite tricarboxylate transporter substrate binding protein n=1 Tax=Rhodoplanes azumiensis TaxID=1897628 RepID=A0ABW5AD06_9BRAD